jgi:PPK2 family polyphosphate:nucleotide phosphotransferase
MSDPTFHAAPHALLVPSDGSFDAGASPTAPGDGAGKKKDWKDALEKEARELGDWQYRLFADGRLAMLIVLQAMDAGGKDGAIRHVFAHINPCGLRVVSFKQPSSLETAHDFLWRTTAALPARGEVAVFNRSHYEEVLVVRVHPQFLAAQSQDTHPAPDFWAERCRSIVGYERHLAVEGTVILKFWLHISKGEQRRRLLARIDDPDKHWKFRTGDLDERDRWDDYLRAYQECLPATSRPWAPWYAIPADDKHYARWQIAQLINQAFQQLGVDFPKSTSDERAAMQVARKRLSGD